MQQTGIFGTYRWFLSTMVVMSHLVPIDYSACGYYAVFAFFILSGYLITLVLHEVYLKDPNGIRRYLLNRFLRIYPIYWLAAAISLALILQLPAIASDVHPFMTLPAHWLQWLANFIILGITLPPGIRIDSILIPPAWSLTTEVTFYLLLPFIVRNRFLWIWWIGMAAAFWISFVIDQKSFHIRYFSILGGMMPFAAGSALYLLKDKLPVFPHWAGISLLSMVAGCCLASAPVFGDAALNEGFIIVFILNLLAIHYLSRVSLQKTRIFRRIDHWLGDMAYPIFLIHLPVAVAMKSWMTDMDVKSIPFFLLCLPAVYLASWLLHIAVEIPVNRMRTRIRPKH